MVNWMDLMRGGGTGKGGDPYQNEKSLFATYPLAKKNAAPLKKPTQKAAVAAAAAAPGALWKQNPPLPLSRPGGPGGGTMTGQPPGGGPGGGTYTGQAPIGGPGGGILTGQAPPGGPGGNTMTGQPPSYPQIMQDQGYGLPQPTPPHDRSPPWARHQGADPGIYHALFGHNPVSEQPPPLTPEEQEYVNNQHYLGGGGGLLGLMYRRHNPGVKPNQLGMSGQDLSAQ